MNIKFLRFVIKGFLRKFSGFMRNWSPKKRAKCYCGENNIQPENSFRGNPSQVNNFS